jgi:TonB-linked SusC/RagA family outer membrane protein
MFKTTLTIVLAALCLNFGLKAQEPTKPPPLKNQAILGKVISATTGQALPGALINVNGNQHNTVSNDNGEFTLTLSNGAYNLSLRFLGYKTRNISIQIPSNESLTIALEIDKNDLKEVEIVSTGYQNISKERATGSFTQVDNQTINRNVGINVLDRLEGVTSGLLLNRGLNNVGSTPKIAIRGRNTLFGNTEPVVVLDGLPYEGNIDQINPADIESITVLKDAAAASIWGARAANGVIVLVTKRGSKNQKLTIGISSTLTLTDKINLSYAPQISSADYIDMEQYLFSKGFYTSSLNNSYSPISAAVAIFNQRKLNKISSADSMAQINALKAHDVRSDVEKYSYRNSVYQQYQLNLSGGDNNSRYYLSGGYDKNLENYRTDSYNRLTIKASNSYFLWKDRIELTGGFNFISGNTNGKSNKYTSYTPYDRLADSEGNPLPVVTASTLRAAYVDLLSNTNLLDWHYRPLDELMPNTLNKRVQYKMNLGADFKVAEGLNFIANYQFLKERTDLITNHTVESFYARNIINQFSSVVNNTIIRAVPLGGILNKGTSDLSSKIVRLQLNFNRVFNQVHEVNAITGYEAGDNRSKGESFSVYGYDPETMTNGNNTINPMKNNPFYYEPALSQRISLAPGLSENIDIRQSYYANVSYSYLSRYVATGSVRKDESNLFGVKTNQKGIPLWSAGILWNVSQENFYRSGWLPYLKLRATYGYNGNVDKSVSAYLTVLNNGLVNDWGNGYSVIANPPNPLLRWEKVKTINFGIDFSSRNSRINGTLEYYKKNSTDLIGNSPIASQSGVTQFRGNSANLRSKGLDIILNSKNIIGKFQWGTTILFNYNEDVVGDYKVKQGSNFDIVSSNYSNPLEGYPYYAIFSFRSAGLDGKGAPQGYLNNQISQNYTEIIRSTDPAELKYHGSAAPKYFGSFINTFNYGNFELSFSLLYKLNYYLKRSGVFNGSNYTYLGSLDYNKRWQKPGEELTTIIPVFVYPANSSSASFFQYSEDLIERGDHIRLQDFRFTYKVPGRVVKKMFLKGFDVFVYGKNMGILWRKNKLNIDPDYGNLAIPQAFSSSLGINITL